MVRKQEPPVSERIEAALNEAAEFPLGWFMVYEGFDAEGDRTLHYVNSDGLAYWQGVGYLYTALDVLQTILDGGGGTEDE